MLLKDYLDRRGDGSISALVEAAGVANSTIHDILNGHRLSNFAVATKIAQATKGRVTVADLMLRTQPKKRKRRTRPRVATRAAA